MAAVDSLQFCCSRCIVAKYLNIFLCPEESTYIKDLDDTFYEEISKPILTAMGKKTVCCVFCLWPERRTDFSHFTCIDEKPTAGKMTSVLQGCLSHLHKNMSTWYLINHVNGRIIFAPKIAS